MKQENKKFISVIGNCTAGKSTIIISLTGCHDRSFRGFVEDQLTRESIYVIADSPQEKELVIEEHSGIEAFIDILTQVIQRDNCRGLVMAIRPTRPRKNPSLENIIHEVQNRNAFESYLFVLEPSRNELRPIFDDINRRLIDTGLVAQRLDGRRFAFLNAQRINQESQLFI